MLENDKLEEVNIKGRKLGQRLNKLEAVLPLKIKNIGLQGLVH